MRIIFHIERITIEQTLRVNIYAGFAFIIYSIYVRSRLYRYSVTSKSKTLFAILRAIFSRKIDKSNRILFTVTKRSINAVDNRGEKS